MRERERGKEKEKERHALSLVIFKNRRSFGEFGDLDAAGTSENI